MRFPCQRSVRITPLSRLAQYCVAGGLALAGGWAAAAPLAAQPTGAHELQRDSADAIEAARRAQGRFERDRVRMSPRDRDGFGSGSCDERLGRMCLRLESGSDWWWPAVEAPEIGVAREELLLELERAALGAPRDGWLLGQRVIYLGEAGRWTEAGELAGRCGVSEEWWCAALEGVSLHVRGRIMEAEAAFERALAGMPSEERTRWLDVDDLLTPEAHDRLERAQERGDSSAIERFWRLSDPLFLVPGNDRYTEHLARRAWSRTREGARNPYAMSWGWDLDELLVRYGWEVGWARLDPSMGSIGASSAAVGHQDPRSQGFVAPPQALDGDPASTPSDWNPGSRRSPRTGHTPAYAPTFLDLDVAVLRLPRGDSTLLVVQVPGVPDDTTRHAAHGHPPAPDWIGDPGAGPMRGLYAAELGGTGRIHGAGEAGTAGPLTLRLPPGDYVVSVETWDPASRTAGRLREGVRIGAAPRDLASLSDLLLARATGSPPTELEQIAGHLLARPVFAPGDTVRVAWEVYGLGWTAEELGYSLALREESGGLFSRLGRAVGLVGDPEATGLDWSEPGPTRIGPQLRSADLVIPTDFDSGAFVLRLELASQGRGTLIRERRLEIQVDAARR